LRLLQEMPLSADLLPADFASGIDANDPWIAILTARIVLAVYDEAQQSRAIARLITLLKDADELIAEEIEDCLVDHFASARPAIEQAAQDLAASTVPIWRSHDYSDRVFERIRKRTQGHFTIQGVAP